MNRKMIIAKKLFEKESFFTYSELSNVCCVSERTIRNDVKELEEIFRVHNVFLKYDKSFGVSIDFNKSARENVQDCYKDILVKEEYETQNQINKMISFILISTDRFSLQTLQDEFGIGRNTAIKYLKHCEEWFLKNDLVLEKKTKIGMKLNYKEYSWRIASLSFIQNDITSIDFERMYSNDKDITDVILNEYTADFLNYFKNQNPVAIKNFIHKFESDNHVRFTDESFSYIFLYICIAIARIKIGKVVHTLEKTNLDINFMEDWIKNNLKIIEVSSQVKFSNEEIRTLLYIMMSVNTKTTFKSAQSDKNFETYIRVFLKNIDSRLCVSISKDDQLCKSLMIHLIPAINRMKFKITIANAMREDIQRIYPYVYKVCKEELRLFEKAYEIEFNPDEASYITLHIASAIEKDRKLIKCLRNVIIVCTSGIGTSNMLQTRVLAEFPNVVIQGIYSVHDLETADLDGVELIISTVPLRVFTSIPIAYVSPLLNYEDKKLIKDKLEYHLPNKSFQLDHLTKSLMMTILQECEVKEYKKLDEKIRKTIISALNDNTHRKESLSLNDFVVPAQIEVNAVCKNWRDAVKKAAYLLVKNKKIKESYVEDLLVSCEEVGENLIVAPGVLLPHANKKENVLQTSMSFLTLKKPILYGKSRESIWYVIVLAATADNSHVQAIGELANLLIDNEVMQAMQKAKTKEELMTVIQRHTEE